jgi:hypothetical protein
MVKRTGRVIDYDNDNHAHANFNSPTTKPLSDSTTNTDQDESNAHDHAHAHAHAHASSELHSKEWVGVEPLHSDSEDRDVLRDMTPVTGGHGSVVSFTGSPVYRDVSQIWFRGVQLDAHNVSTSSASHHSHAQVSGKTSPAAERTSPVFRILKTSKEDLMSFSFPRDLESTLDCGAWC